jgi:hypothetical protein
VHSMIMPSWLFLLGKAFKKAGMVVNQASFSLIVDSSQKLTTSFDLLQRIQELVRILITDHARVGNLFALSTKENNSWRAK